MITKSDIDEFEERLGKIKYFGKFLAIVCGDIEYTNADLDELIEHYTKKEHYNKCVQLQKLKK